MAVIIVISIAAATSLFTMHLPIIRVKIGLTINVLFADHFLAHAAQFVRGSTHWTAKRSHDCRMISQASLNFWELA